LQLRDETLIFKVGQFCRVILQLKSDDDSRKTATTYFLGNVDGLEVVKNLKIELFFKPLVWLG
jgi:hypothetical protein